MSQLSPDAGAAPSTPADGAPPPFAHLHCHTHYSLLDGMTKIPDLVRQTKASGMNAAAITDHGNLYGAMEFYHACRAEDVNPILGIEAYMAPRSRTERGGKMKESNFHLTLLAQNLTGFRNLVKMSSVAYTEGFYYKPRMDKELLAAHSEGLIVLSGCVSGELSRHLLNEQKEEAEKLCQWYTEVFGDRFYMEIQDSGIQIQKDAGEATIDLANRMGLPLVATNDSHYLCGEDAVAHDILLCVNTRSQRTDAKRMRLGSQDFFVKSPEEMYKVFPNQQEAVRRSQEIADRCDIQLEENPKYYPVFKPPRQLTDTEYLREICENAMEERYGDEATQAHRDRLDLELGVIEYMGYSSYFLIVWDFVEFAKKHDIPCVARGSAAGAIVAFLLGLSDVCPLKYDLLFERFLDKSRKEPPDIDIDFCRDRRQMVIDYTKEKYGEDSVAQIGTFGTLKAKAVVRDVGRALGVPLARVNEIAKAVPDTLGIKLADAVKQSPELSDAYNNDPQIKELIDIAYRLEGLARSAGTHAAGVVVADQPLQDLLPLQVITGKEDVITQWDGPTVEAAGLLKMDFLGLRNLTILDKSIKNVLARHPDFDLKVLHDVDTPDPATYRLLQRGETKGVFQLESGGMRDLLTKMRPDKFADIIATSALYRPGPLEGGMVMDYVDIKNGRKQVAKIHPLVDPVLADTYGIMVYQEQVMRILNRVGGIELASAYKCIKAISKKKLAIIAQFRQQYIDGAKERGVDESVAVNLFELIEKFAGYGFNKSHSTAYGLIAYQTAYLKAHYPVEFMAALLSCGMESSDRIMEHVEDARRQGIEVLPPDVNRSDVEFSVVTNEDGQDGITFGLGAVKGLGLSAMEALVREREANGPYKDIFDVTERIDPGHLNRSATEILIRCGALDSLGPTRAQHSAVVDRAVQAAANKARDAAAGQASLFGGDDDEEDAPEVAASFPDLPDWTRAVKLAHEKEVFGFYLTSHPLTEAGDAITKFATATTLELGEAQDGDEVTVGGMVGAIKKARTKKPSRNGNTDYVMFDFEDPEGCVRCIMWPEEFARQGDLVKAEAVLYVKGKVDRRGREPNLIVNRLMTADDAIKEHTRQLAVKFQKGLHADAEMARVREILGRYPGETDVVVLIDTGSAEDLTGDGANGDGANGETPGVRTRYRLSTPGHLRVSCGPGLRRELAEVLGEQHLLFWSPPVRRKTASPSLN
ncbi:DNA polymerase III subunit alpha [Alienimonas californiensis]|uniref:DNA polymerase III subunit alpha n=1 Tax=Alienimonas californiensis TaxID=2527989 RepID=A0A517P9K8_9PLAN|nr:DNA polymerase III subunit alpha [Alienimonas californiensis]QDT16067.1 DNA polymerase III subunit alpha [Alienimonas californiensis]